MVNVLLTTTVEIPLRMQRSVHTILDAIAEKLKRQSKDDFDRRHFEAWLIVRAVPGACAILSFRDLEEMVRERVFAVDQSTH